MRYKATITRVNSTQMECDLIAASLTQATYIASQFVRDGETLCVEPMSDADVEVIDYSAHTGDYAS
jgi:hypothetical protein